MNFKKFMSNDEKMQELIGSALNGKELNKNVKSLLDRFDYNGGELPTVTRKGKIISLETKRNPIRIRLSDGTECFFTYDQFNRIQGNPQIGKTMTVVFQRHPSKKDSENSPIKKIIVSD